MLAPFLLPRSQRIQSSDPLLSPIEHQQEEEEEENGDREQQHSASDSGRRQTADSSLIKRDGREPAMRVEMPHFVAATCNKWLGLLYFR